MGITRLVYAPKAYVFTKNQEGQLYDLTPYVVSGSVQRLINQPSSAEVELRNPYRIFTTPSQGVPLHPMDPITIYLERIQGYPVRVFTGFLDSTPYYQLHPGTVNIQATCTLKRLLYTYFDPSLPYMMAFLQQYGWIRYGTSSIISGQTGNSNLNQAQAGFTQAFNLQDGSIGKLLWATLYEIGEWDDTHIYIEALPNGPNGIVARMEALMANFDQAQSVETTVLDQFFQSIMGGSSYGAGGGNLSGTANGTSGGLIKNTSGLTVKASPMNAQQAQIASQIVSIGLTINAPFSAMVGAVYVSIWEGSLANSNPMGDSPGNSGVGIQPNDVQINDWYKGITPFQQGGIAIANKNSTENLVTLVPYMALITQGQTKTGLQYRAEMGYGTDQRAVAEAVDIVNAYMKQNPGPGSSSASTTTGNNPRGTAITNTATNTVPTSTITGNNPRGTSISTSTTLSGTIQQQMGQFYTSPFPGGNNGARVITVERLDMGADFVLGPPGSNIVAIGNGTLLGTSEPGWPGPGGFMWYQLTDGPNQGAIIYYAEGIAPIGGIGPKLTMGQPIATVADQSSGVEFGYCDAGGNTLGAHEWTSQSVPDPQRAPTDQGLRFARFLQHLGVRVGGTGPGNTGPPPGTGPFQPSGNLSIAAGGVTSAGVTSAGGNNTGAASSVLSQSAAQAFTTQLDFPTIEDSIAAITLGSEGKGLMHDQDLLSFVQQLTQASMRNFMSLPNGDFFAFYPDYFGEMGVRKPYWNIDDLEIIDGTISISDDALATHVYAVGDNTWPMNDELMNEMFSAGSVSIFNAFASEDVLQSPASSTAGKKSKGKAKNDVPGPSNGLLDVMSAPEAAQFIQRFGARPLVQPYPMVRSPIYEMLLAYQQFMMAWSNQFLTPFTFTFMPELFPGGKVAFPNHGLMMYIDSVTHTWDYQGNGFTTTAEMKAPSLIPGVTTSSFPDLPPEMVQAMAEPIKPNNPDGTPKGKSIKAWGQPSGSTILSRPTPAVPTAPSLNPNQSITGPNGILTLSNSSTISNTNPLTP